MAPAKGCHYSTTERLRRCVYSSDRACPCHDACASHVRAIRWSAFAGACIVVTGLAPVMMLAPLMFVQKLDGHTSYCPPLCHPNGCAILASNREDHIFQDCPIPFHTWKGEITMPTDPLARYNAVAEELVATSPAVAGKM